MLFLGDRLKRIQKKDIMNNSSSPLEMLTALAITFVAGSLSVVLVATYGHWKQRQGALTTQSGKK